MRTRATMIATSATLQMVLSILQDREGDHMVASTKFAKRFAYIYEQVARGGIPAVIAREVSDTTDFAGSWGYDFAPQLDKLEAPDDD